METPLLIILGLVGLQILNEAEALYWLGRIAGRFASIFVKPGPTSGRYNSGESLVVREIEHGRATLMVRRDAAAKAASAHLIVWGAGGHMLGKTYHDLGSRPAETFGTEVVEAFIATANERLKQMASAKESQDKPAGTPAKTAPTEGELAISVKRVPTVTRGMILEIGFMKRAMSDREISQFGVRYRTTEGVEDVVWGVDLKRALKEAEATVGDKVEILKVGRKVVEEGRAPMNLWKIAKIL
ncbi:MAG: hypothetical protein HS122_19760 [Opitutaceae bacterium]|nr:hypothetical protein [Opitutaceae bacterium]